MDCTCGSLFHALAEPSKSAIIEHLLLADATVSELSSTLGFEQSRTSHAIGVLEDIGIVLKTREGRETSCSIAPGIRPILARLDALRSEYHERHCQSRP